ncbi:MAG: hypothetical protein JWR55_3177 [Aeromicrobium sp.]|jgi:hypothetical protein|nr:hypothetical protein [Aeromicrobium sp.]
MNRTAAGVLTGVVALAVLSGCGGEDPYCAAVTENKTALDGFGTRGTQADFTAETKAVRSVTTAAHDDIKDDWSAVGAAMARVAKALKAADVSIEDLDDAEVRRDMSQEHLDEIRASYEAFNQTSKQRTAVVEDVLQKCEITLK